MLADKRLYMTATPRVYTDAVKKKAEQAAGAFDVYSMDDADIYGPELYRMSFSDAVEGGHLTDYKVLVIAVAENPVLNAYDSIEVEHGRPFSIGDAVRFAGCWDGLADPTTTTAEGRVTGAVNPRRAARRAIAFTNRIKTSEQVEKYWNPVIEAMSRTSERLTAPGPNPAPSARGAALAPQATHARPAAPCSPPITETPPTTDTGKHPDAHGRRRQSRPEEAPETTDAGKHPAITAFVNDLKDGELPETPDAGKHPASNEHTRRGARLGRPATTADGGRLDDGIDRAHERPRAAETVGQGGGRRLLECEVRHVDGTKNALQRADTIAWLRDGDPGGGCRIVTNARCLTEGIDVPALDAVMFLEPRQSQVDVIQAVGRVMRRAEHKQVGYVMLPVVVPTGASLLDDQVLSGSDFKAVWKVLKALRSHDERLDVAINTADLTGKPPITVLPSGLCEACGRARSECACDPSDPDTPGAGVRLGQQRLTFEQAIASRVVEACGDRQYWDRWGREVARITGTVTEHIRAAVRANEGLAEQFDRFAQQMRATVGGSLPSGDLAVMAAQHVVTMPVFDALFAGSGFADRNPISRSLNELLKQFESAGVRLGDETVELERFYASVRNRLSGAADSDARLKIMLEVYESFFKEAMPAEIQRLGIAYTPVELVDFILRSADAVLRKEFGRGLTSPGVHILDPFTGTGTFINRLLTQNNSAGRPLVASVELDKKFLDTRSPATPGGGPPEVHANEIVLLAYYLAAIKIEEGYRERTGRYRPFTGIVLTDTFIHDPAALPGTGAIRHNTDRAKQQNELPIQVIVANPPWSAGQKKAGDDNPGLEYPHIEQRVRDTYGRWHKKVTGHGAGGNSAGNLYVQAIRWASDRLNTPDGDTARPGIVAFVHPNSLSNATSLAGMRAALRDEFTDIYVVNLLGDAMKSGEDRRREGDSIFGQSTRNGVQITLLVRNPGKDLSQPAELRYATVPEYYTTSQKFEWLKSLGDVTSESLQTVPINKSHDWINLTDGTFDELLPVCATGKNHQSDETAVSQHASGVKTNCDAYVYSFSRDALAARVQEFAAAYEHARSRVSLGASIKEATRNDELETIKWTGTLKQSLRNDEEIVFDETRIREVLYRPFVKLWLYEDDRILSSVKTIARLFPRQENAATPPPAILLAGPANRSIFSTVATHNPIDLNICGAGGARTAPRKRSSPPEPRT